MLAASAGLSPAVESTQQAPIGLSLRADFAWDQLEAGAKRRVSRPPLQSRYGSASRSRSPIAKRSSTTEKVIGTAAGGALGFLAGGYIGAAINTDRDGPYDDGASAFKGLAIGAPIGAAVGAILGWRLTR
jgi:hypothetical protein